MAATFCSSIVATGSQNQKIQLFAPYQYIVVCWYLLFERTALQCFGRCPQQQDGILRICSSSQRQCFHSHLSCTLSPLYVLSSAVYFLLCTCVYCLTAVLSSFQMFYSSDEGSSIQQAGSGLRPGLGEGLVPGTVLSSALLSAGVSWTCAQGNHAPSSISQAFYCSVSLLQRADSDV